MKKIIKKITGVIISCVMLTNLFVVSAVDEVNISEITVSSQNASIGQTVEISVDISTVQEFGGMQLELSYNNTQLEYVLDSGVINETLGTTAMVKTLDYGVVDSETSKLAFVYAATKGLSGNRNIFKAKFNVLDTTAKSLELNIAGEVIDATLDLNAIPVKFSKGYIKLEPEVTTTPEVTTMTEETTVTEETTTPEETTMTEETTVSEVTTTITEVTTTPEETTTSEETTITEETTVSEVTTTITEVTTTPEETTLSEVTTTETTIEPVAGTGDMDGNGKTTVLDLVIMKKIILGINDFENVKPENGDMNGDGKIAAVDLVLMIQILLKI